MGGFSSGRYRTRVRVADGLIMDLGRLLRQQSIEAGGYCAGSLTWTSKATKEVRASIGFESNLTHPDESYVRLHYRVGDKPMDYQVWLRRTPCRCGGFRWWWICPSTGHAAAKLYLPPGATTFASRRAYCIGYRSWGGGPMDRSHDRQRRIYSKLGEEYRYYEQGPPKRPKGMHQRTYDRLVAGLFAAMDRHEVIFNIGAARIPARDPAMRAHLYGRG
jgi:hypothetical protein